MAGLKTPISQSAPRTTLIDQVDSNTTYIGVGKTGEATSSAVWQIRKLLTSGTVTTIKYANGSDAYNQIWDNRSSLSYS
jgi:hypothetical protein